LNIALEQHWQGMLLFPNAPDTEIAKLARSLREFEISLVVLGQGPLDTDSVRLDVAHGIRLLLDHAHEQGMRRICVFGWAGEMQDLARSPKFKSVEADLRYRGMELVAAVGYEELVSHGPALYHTAYRAFEEALGRGLEADLVIGANDVIAIAAMNCLLNHGRRVPDDVAVSGYDDTEHAQYARPPLTTIGSPREEIVELGWGMLRRRLNGEPGAPRAVTVLPTLIVRESTGVRQTVAGVLEGSEAH
jgi:DNA-binding LacI/PurR family transcriptional regulator